MGRRAEGDALDLGQLSDEGRRRTVAGELGERHPHPALRRRTCQPRCLLQGGTARCVFVPIDQLPHPAHQPKSPRLEPRGVEDEGQHLVDGSGR